MSKQIVGRYKDGTIQHSYFRKTRHHRIERNGFLPIRWKMFCAKAWQEDTQLNKKYGS